MKARILLLAVLLLLFATSAWATDSYFYYGESQVSLTAIDEYVVAKADPNQFTT